MIKDSCLKCKGDLEPQEKVIETVSPEDNYEIRTARLHECIDCGHRCYVSE